MSNYEKCRILWIDGRLLFSPREFRLHWYGLCDKTKRVCKIANRRDVLTPLIVNGTIIGICGCEEKERCLDFECPYNRTTKESFKKSYHVKSQLPDDFAEKPMIFNSDPACLERYKELLRHHDEQATAMTLIPASRRSKE